MNYTERYFVLEPVVVDTSSFTVYAEVEPATKSVTFKVTIPLSVSYLLYYLTTLIEYWCKFPCVLIAASWNL